MEKKRNRQHCRRVTATLAIPRIAILSCVTTAGAIGCIDRQLIVVFVFVDRVASCALRFSSLH